MLRKVKLYGELAKFVGHKEFEVQADTVGKAVSFLVHNFPEVERFMNPKYYQVKVGNYDIDESELAYPVGQEDIHIVPVMAGAGGSTGKILLGAALIGGAFLFTPLTMGSFFSPIVAPGIAKARPINAAPNNTFPNPRPAPLIAGIKCISSCPTGYANSLSSMS